MTQPVDPVTVDVTNLRTGTTYSAGTTGNDYTLVLNVGSDVNRNDTLRYIAKDDTNFINVTDHVVTQGEIDAGTIALDLVLDEFYLDLVDFPMYEADPPEHNQMCGPAVGQMVLNYMYWDSDEDPVPPTTFDSQQELYDYGIPVNENPALEYLDAVGMWHVVQDFRPLPYSQYGYNFSRRHDVDGMEMVKQIAQWVAYTIGTFGGHEEGHPFHVPGVIPAYGDYSNWMAVRGIHTNEDAYPLPPTLEVYGFWINDPFPASMGGIGENSYKTIDELMATYYLPLSTGDSYDGEFVAICEPPESLGDEDVVPMASPGRYSEAIANFIKFVRTMDSPPGNLVDAAHAFIIDAAISGVTDQLIPYDEAFARRFADTIAETPIFVKNDLGGDYYAVPFNSCKNTTTPTDEECQTVVVVLVDDADGHFKEASWVRTPVDYLPLSEADAWRIAGEILEKLQISLSNLKVTTVELTHVRSTPYYPHWVVTGPGFNFLIAQDGSVDILPAYSDSP
jgi:hypothetical protein